MHLLRSLCLAGVLLIGLAVPGWAAEFSADVKQSLEGQAMDGKIFVKDGKIRNERAIPNGPAHITIMDREAKQIIMLNPASKTYMLMDSKRTSQLSMQDDAELETKAERTVLGTEKMQGYECEKVRYVFKDKEMGTTTQWLCKKLGYPLRTEVDGPHGKMVMELVNIREGSQPADLFEVPAGWTKTEMPGMMHGRMGAPGQMGKMPKAK